MTTLATPSDVSVANSRRRVRLDAQRLLWSESSISRVRRCGKVMHDVTAGVQLRRREDSSGVSAAFAGFQTCGSVWACPCCSAKIAASRQTDIETAVRNWLKDGGRVAFFTFTVRHHQAQRLQTVWSAVSAAHRSIMQSRTWKTLRHRFGRHVDGQKLPVLPWVRVHEVTHGSNGWHPHQHMLIFLPGDTTDTERDEMFDATWAQWNKGAVSAGVDGSLKVNRAEWVEADAKQIAGYFAKQTYDGPDAAGRAALETMRGDLKSAKFGNRTSMQILRDVVIGGEVEDLELWHEFEAASKGRRQLTWARGARDLLLGSDEELTDEEIAAEELGTRDDAICFLDRIAVHQIQRVRGRRAELLEATERSAAEAILLLNLWRIQWEPPPRKEI